MKARVKATGEIVEVKKEYDLCNAIVVVFYSNEEDPYEVYEEEELDFDVKEPPKPRYNPDYWTKLEHQYAGMAMQGMLATLYSPKYHKELMACYTEVDAEEVARLSKYYAHALVEKMKNQSV